MGLTGTSFVRGVALGRASRLRRQQRSLRTSCLARGVTVQSVERVNANRVQLRVRVSGDATERAMEDGLEELGRAVKLPRFGRGRNAPLPAAAVLAALGEAKVAKHAVGKLVVGVVCDHAADNGRLVRTDLTPDMAVEQLDELAAAFRAGESLQFEAAYDFMER